MFSPRSSSRSKASPFTPTSHGAKSAQSKRVSSLFTPQRKSHYAAKTHGAGNRSTLQTSQLLEETPNFRVERFGTPLPVLITEALTYADKSTRISVRLEESGWAWLVGGRKLFVWRYKQAVTGRNVLCKELTLPPSDLAHSAARVCVLPHSGDSQSAACVAVSPEGVVRYWANIAYEASSMEISAELKGEECDCVVNLSPYGCLLATTTSSLVLLSTVPTQNTVTCRPLKAAHGMFAGIGRRMSSLIFGAAPGQATGAPLQAVVAGNQDADELPFYMLSGTHFQKWMVTDTNLDKFVYQVDVDRLFRDALARKVWDQDAIQMTQLTTWILDIQVTKDGVMMLGAGLNQDAQPLVHYALAILPTEISGTPSSLQSFTVLQLTRTWREDQEGEILGYRLLYPDTNSDDVYLYDDQSVVMASLSGGTPDEVPAPGGRLLGAGSSDRSAVFFSISQGLFSICSTQKQDISILGDVTQDSVLRADMSGMGASSTQLQEMSMSEDKSARLKAAFLMACSGDVQQAQDIVDELFPTSIVSGGNQTTEIDRLVSQLSRDLIDDYPASDPRWAESVRTDMPSSTSSLIIGQQLKDKQRAHEYIINFLQKLAIWPRLQTVMVGQTVMSTRLLLCQHAEQLEAAIALREMHSEYSDVIDPAIRKVLSFRGEQMSTGLAPQDIFYREVSHIHEIFEALVEFETDIMAGDFAASDIIRVVSSVNPVIEGMLTAALQYRHSKASMYGEETQLDPVPEYIPWTSSTGNQGIRNILLKQFGLTVESALPEARDLETRGALYQQLLGLADHVLDGYTSQLASLAQNPRATDHTAQLEEKFLQQRTGLISPFLEGEQYERAASLAEKYLDFEILVRVCEDTRNQDRIQRYQEQFKDKGFSDFLFSWYMKEGKRGRLLSMPGPQQTQLQSFLQNESLGYLKWLHDVECGDFKSAHDTLLELGRSEEQFLSKKKTLLSLSKLAALASDTTDEEMMTNVTDINEEQELILHQELLPRDLLENMNMDPDLMNVLTPLELIQMYVCAENDSATEYDYKKALDLMQFIDQDDLAVDYDGIRTDIWCRAFLRDAAVWQHKSSGDAMDSVRNTIFFRLISLAINQGWDPTSFLPDKQRLLHSQDLGAVGQDPQVQYLLGAVYEHVASGVH